MDFTEPTTEGTRPTPRAVTFRRDSSPHDSKPLDARAASRSIDLMFKESGMNEASPLMSPSRRSGDDERLDRRPDIPSPQQSDDWDEDQAQKTKSSWYLMLLTIAIGGLQISWSVELAYGSPYLLGLGLSKSMLAFVWIAGPLSGTLVQPYIGIKSDRSRHKWGKRRPFIVGGALATIVSLFCLAWAKEIVTRVLGLFGVDETAQAVYTIAIVFAVLLIYILDFAINVSKYSVSARTRDYHANGCLQYKPRYAHSLWTTLQAISRMMPTPGLHVCLASETS